MHRFLQLPHRTALDAGSASRPWHDLKRDWDRWSRAERLTAECFAAAVLIGATLALALLTLS